MLGQSELTILVNPHLPSKIFQGITTEITGEGGSVATLNDAISKADHVGYEHFGLTPTWRDLAGYFTRLERQGLGINLATYVGATQVRRMVLGDSNRAPSAAELDAMKGLVRTAMTEPLFPADSAWTPPENVARLVAKLASGRYDALSGRYIHAEQDDPDELLARLDEVNSRDLNAVRLQR